MRETIPSIKELQNDKKPSILTITAGSATVTGNDIGQVVILLVTM